MWGSLLFLPTTAALAIYLLYRLDDARLRRSLQLAILLSLAAHLLILIIASTTNIFQNNFQQQRPKIAKKQKKTITIRNRDTNFVWEQPNLRPTPDPQVEVKREQTTTQPKPQTVPVEPSKPTTNPQITRRETPSKSVPRLDKQLSQLRRQTKQSPQLSSTITSQPTASRQPSQKAAQSAAAASASAASRQSAASNLKRTERQPTQAQASPSRSAERKATARTQTASTPSPSPAARIRRSSPRMPQTTSRQLATNSTRTPTQTSRPTPQPSKSATQLTRRENTKQTPNPSRTNRPRTVASPQSAIAKTSERRPRPPTISRPNATPQTPRRSSVTARVPTTTRVMESPTRAPRSPSEARQITVRSLSVSRGESGTAGAIRERNLQREVGGQVSPATQPSASAARRTSQVASQNQLLTPSQSATERRSIAQARAPSSAYKANTQNATAIVGSSNPSEQTLQASAASSQTSATAPTAEISAQKGEAALDVGPTKIVAEQTSRRRSGGGQPETGSIELDNLAQSSRQSTERAPTLSAEMGTQTAASISPTAAPAGELETQPNEESLTHSRSGAEQPMSYDRSAAVTNGPASDAGSAELAGAVADSRQRSERDTPLSSGDSDDTEDEELQTNGRSRLAQAPSISSQVEFGSGDMETANTGRSQPNGAESELTESIAGQVVERATSGALGSALARSATGQMMQAVASMPVTNLSSTRKNGRSQSTGNVDGPTDANSQGRLQNRMARTGTSSVPRLSDLPTSNDSQLTANQLGAAESATGIQSANVTANRQSQAAGARLEVDAVAGPAGLGESPSVSLGVRTRPASRDSDQILPEIEQRFRSRSSGGTPAINPNAIVAKDAFRSRQPSSIGNAGPSTEAAIQLGLEFLARYQNPDGSWSLHRFDQSNEIQQERQLKSDSAATGLALLAFQGAGYTHKEFKYAGQVDRALKWLIENQQDNGCLFVPSGNRSDESCLMYSHAISTLALCEAYGMTQDPELLEATQDAIDWIVRTQDPKHGGWRYFPDRRRRRTDTSVTGWMLMALQSARLAGLDVENRTLEAIDAWLDLAVDPSRPSQYRYNPFSNDTSSEDRSNHRKATPSMTAVGLLMRVYGGLEKDDPVLLDGARSLIDQQMPSDNDSVLRDTYYWYYATQVLKHVDGELWETWNDQLHPLLVNSQKKTGDMAGSWHPYEPVPDRWGIHAGRLYVTTMNLLSLEVRYRLLPLYEETLK